MAATDNQKPDVRLGTRFGEGGRYEIRKRIGRGGMADVYKVADTQLPDKVFAVKILSIEDDDSVSEARRRELAKLRSLFLEEAFALSRVRDSNVVTIFSNGRLSDAKQTPYMLMEYLDGADLSRTLKKLAERNELMAIDRAAEIILGVCAGVQAVHLGGVIHRDLKPANIFLEQTAKGEVVKVLDFSIAKVPLSRDQTNTDFVIGTDDYMAPEQRDKKPATELSDQYSIGALLFKCLTGEAPRGLFARLRERRPQIPEALETSIYRAMNTNPELRFASVHEFGQSIQPFATAEARARWKHYYTTPPLPIRPALTGPIAITGPIVPARNPPGIPELLPGTRVAAYDFRVHDRTTSIGPETVAPATTVDHDRDPIPSNIEVSSLVGGPPTKETAPPTDVDAPHSYAISVASASGTVPPPAATPKVEVPPPSNVSAVTVPRFGRSRSAIAAIILLPLLLGAGVLARARLHRSDPVPATAPEWTRRAVEIPPHSTSTPTPPSPNARPVVIAPPPPAGPTASTEPPAPAPGRTTSDEPSRRPVDSPHRRKRLPKIQYDVDGFPLLH